MSKKNSVPMHRLNLVISKAAYARLHAMRKQTGAHTVTEVIRSALAVYECILEQRTSGARVVVKTGGGTEKELLVAIPV